MSTVAAPPNVARSRAVVGLLILLGVVCIVIGAIYFAEPASKLPAFFPGHVSTTSSLAHHHHVTHGTAAVVVGLLCWAGAWFLGGNRASSAP